MLDHVNSVRGIGRWTVRSVAVLLAGVGAYLLLKRVAFALMAGDVTLAFRIWSDTGQTHEGSSGAAMIAIAAALALTGDRLVRWAVPVPPTGCPGCGHTDAPAADGTPSGSPTRCPECGLRRARTG
jgi:hypothetical protein